jgi:hypothetical protein
VKVPDYTLRFQGVVSDRVAVTQYAVLSEGIEKGALKVYRGKYTVVLADPQSLDVVTSLSSTGVNAFDVEKRSIDQVLIGFWPEPVAPSKITWTDRTVSPALSGKCNLLNLVIFPTPSTQQDKKPEAWPTTTTRSVSGASVGDRVLGQWRDGLWYPATVRGVGGNGLRLAFDDGGAATVRPSQVRPVDWNVGTRVQCNWKGGGRYYPGIIGRKDGDQVFINYDDGGKELTTIGRCRSS